MNILSVVNFLTGVFGAQGQDWVLVCGKELCTSIALEIKLNFIDYVIILLSWLVATHRPPKLTLIHPYIP